MENAPMDMRSLSRDAAAEAERNCTVRRIKMQEKYLQFRHFVVRSEVGLNNSIKPQYGDVENSVRVRAFVDSM
jgi:hypothetical protein